MIPNDFSFKTRDYRAILKSEFEIRKQRRTNYSSRAFARDVGLASSQLSAVLRGRYGLSEISAKLICDRLHYTDEQTKFFIDLVESEHARTKFAREQAKKRVERFLSSKKFRELDDSKLELLDKWFYSAVLEMFELNGELGVAEVARKLRISEREVDESIRFLLRNGFVSKTENEIKVRSKFLVLRGSTPKPVIRKFHGQVLDQVKDAIEREAVEDRKNLSTIFSFDREQTEDARKWIDEMHKEFLTKFGTAKSKDSVMAFAVHLVPLNDRSSDA